jgi:hypothetical protein
VKAFKVELWLDIFVGRGFWWKVGRSTYRLGEITNPFQLVARPRHEHLFSFSSEVETVAPVVGFQA